MKQRKSEQRMPILLVLLLLNSILFYTQYSIFFLLPKSDECKHALFDISNNLIDSRNEDGQRK